MSAVYNVGTMAKAKTTKTPVEQAPERAPRTGPATYADVEETITELKDILGRYESLKKKLKPIGWTGPVIIQGVGQRERAFKFLKDWHKRVDERWKTVPPPPPRNPITD